MKHWMKLIVLAIASVMLLAACGGDSASPTTGTGNTGGTTGAQELTLSVSGELLKFDKETLTAKAGQPIKITFNNTSSALPHSFVIDNPKVSIPADPAAGLPTKQSGSAEVTLQAGTYNYYCGVVGHKEGGMVGVLTVQ